MEIDLIFQKHLGKYVLPSSSLLWLDVQCNVKEQISGRSYVMLNVSHYVVVALQVLAKIFVAGTFILKAET
jgi:hypothetical protein